MVGSLFQVIVEFGGCSNYKGYRFRKLLLGAINVLEKGNKMMKLLITD